MLCSNRFAVAVWVLSFGLLLAAAPLAHGQKDSALAVSQPSPEPFVRSRVVVASGNTRDAITRLTNTYRKTGRAKILRQSYKLVYPYGHAQPVLKCALLRACLVELNPEEVIIGVIAGDTERWLIEQTFTGTDGATPVVVVKPTAEDITTNLIVTTDRRIYHLTLDSAPATGGTPTNPQEPYTRHVSFYYPDALVQQMKGQEKLEQSAARRAASQVAFAGVSLGDLNYNYTWNETAVFPWAPQVVFDDGTHVYIKRPPEAQHAELPLLFELGPGEVKEVINYATRGDFYITDRLFKRAALVIGVDKKSGFLGLGKEKRVQRRLDIVNREMIE